jgi:ribA/ribD-fused uncharacterized protein
MHYDIQWLLEQQRAGRPIKFLFFWGHTPSFGETTGKCCLSQWYDSPFQVEGVLYKTAEHWMMAKKALLFEDNVMYDRIIAATKPGEAKELGKLVANFDDATWSAHKYSIVMEGNQHKFSRHNDLKQFLLNTYDRVLVEASPLDRIWGIGLAEDHPSASHADQWKGENLLGFALMEVRDSLKY